MAIGTLIVGLGLLIAWPLLSDEPAAPAEQPAQLAATYVGSAKCKMCHKGRYEMWAKTKHSKVKPPTPDEKTGEKPSDEEIARRVTAFDPATKQGAEDGVTCEMCHGPGSLHLKASKDQRKATIFNPTEDAPNPSVQFSVCAQCHARYTLPTCERWSKGFIPGMNLVPSMKLDPAKPGQILEQFNELQGSKHVEKGVTCVKCHTGHVEDEALPHQLRKPIIEQCATCHVDKKDPMHCPNAKPGDTCTTCHMPDGIHTFRAKQAQ